MLSDNLEWKGHFLKCQVSVLRETAAEFEPALRRLEFASPIGLWHHSALLCKNRRRCSCKVIYVKCIRWTWMTWRTCVKLSVLAKETFPGSYVVCLSPSWWLKVEVKLLALSHTQLSSRARDSLAHHVFPKCCECFTSPRKKRVYAVKRGMVFCLKHPLVCQTVSCYIVISHLLAWQCQTFNITIQAPKSTSSDFWLIFFSLA